MGPARWSWWFVSVLTSQWNIINAECPIWYAVLDITWKLGRRELKSVYILNKWINNDRCVFIPSALLYAHLSWFISDFLFELVPQVLFPSHSIFTLVYDFLFSVQKVTNSAFNLISRSKETWTSLCSDERVFINKWKTRMTFWISVNRRALFVCCLPGCCCKKWWREFWGDVWVRGFEWVWRVESLPSEFENRRIDWVANTKVFPLPSLLFWQCNNATHKSPLEKVDSPRTTQSAIEMME